MPEYEELIDIEDDEETQKIKKRIERGKNRGREIIQTRIKDSKNYKKPKFGCFSKIRHDFSSYINYRYSFNKNGNHFLFLLVTFIIAFTFYSFMMMHHMYIMLLIPTGILFIYHFIMAVRAYNVYLGGFFFIQLALQVTMLFYQNHFVAFGITSLVFTIIHLFVAANWLDLRFYLRVCILLGILYMGLGIKQTDKYIDDDYYFFYFMIFLGLVNIAINKFTLFQLLVFWIPQTIKLFFVNTCCGPKIQFKYKEVWIYREKYIMKGTFFPLNSPQTSPDLDF